MNDYRIPLNTKDFSNSKIPPGLAVLPSSVDDTSSFNISFSSYKESLCQINNLRKNKGSNTLDKLKVIGLRVFREIDLYNLGYQISPVHRSGHYKEYFNGLSQDVDLFELKLGGTGRMFFFVLSAERLISIVAFRETHTETKKKKR